MYAAELTFKILRKADEEAVDDAIADFLIILKRSGQILGIEWPTPLSPDCIRAFVSIPERTSLQRKYENRWAPECRAALTKTGLSQPTYRILGRELNTLRPCRCNDPSAYILYAEMFAMDSPLRCADCFAPVPLYRIPYTAEWGTFEDLLAWQEEYANCDKLQIRITVGERYCLRQMGTPDSRLSREGLGLRDRIEEVTGKRCYYYLYRFYGRSLKREQQRRCPVCGGEWILDDLWLEKFDFRCERCRLVSNLAYSVL